MVCLGGIVSSIDVDDPVFLALSPAQRREAIIKGTLPKIRHVVARRSLRRGKKPQRYGSVVGLK